jgi:hypothetical protein
MAVPATVTYGSGILPSLATHPNLSGIFFAGTYPQTPYRNGQLTSTNTNAVAVLNAEDWSAHFGVRHRQLTATAVAQEVTISPLEFRRAVAIQNLGPATVYLGDSTVTSSTGYPLNPNSNKEIAMDIKGTIKVYVITASGEADLRILELS